MIESLNFNTLLEISKKAGDAILKIYETDFEVEYKDDKSPLTAADKAANEEKMNPDIPIISEENKALSFEERKDWTYCWIVDPLDGTKEFLKRNDEFTVNIALIKNGVPVAGVVYLPVTKEYYYADLESKAWYKKEDGMPELIVRI